MKTTRNDAQSFETYLGQEGQSRAYGMLPRWVVILWSLGVVIAPPMYWQRKAVFFVYTYAAATNFILVSMAVDITGASGLHWPIERHLSCGLCAGGVAGAIALLVHARSAARLKGRSWWNFLAWYSGQS